MMNRIKTALFAMALFTFSTVMGQEKRQINASDDLASNTVKSKIVAVSTFKQPVTVEIFSAKEKDNQNRTVVNGLTVKGSVISATVSSVGNLAGGGSGAAAASYAATGRSAPGPIKITISQPETGDEATTFADESGNFSVTLKHDTLRDRKSVV